MQTTVVQIDRRAGTLCGGGGGRERTEEREEAEEGASGAEDLQDQDRARILYKPGSVGGGRKQRGRVLSPPPQERRGWVGPSGPLGSTNLEDSLDGADGGPRQAAGDAPAPAGRPRLADSAVIGPAPFPGIEAARGGSYSNSGL